MGFWKNGLNQQNLGNFEGPTQRHREPTQQRRPTPRCGMSTTTWLRGGLVKPLSLRRSVAMLHSGEDLRRSIAMLRRGEGLRRSVAMLRHDEGLRRSVATVHSM